MLRGTLVLFAGAFTILILRRQLYIHNWLGMVLITAGAALVGASSVIYQGPPGHNNTLLAPADGAMPLLLNHTNPAAAGGWGGAGSSLHYSAGISRLASRGMLGVGVLGSDAAAFSSSSSSSNHGAGSSWFASAWQGGLAGVFGLRAGEAGVAAAPLFGDLLVVAAQMFTALQFILEEKFLVKYKVGGRQGMLLAPADSLYT